MVKQKLSYKKAWYLIAIARITLGFVFLWAFFDKLLGLGFSTSASKAWIVGGSPSGGFLKHVEGPFASLFNSLAGNPFIDWLFMIGLLGIGLALLLGIGLRVAAVTGTILLILMWLASLPIATNPFIDDHLVYALMLLVFASSPRLLSVAGWWLKLPYVKRHHWLW